MVEQETYLKNKTFKKIFEETIKKELSPKTKKCAVLFSGGVDSLSTVFALLELNITPVLYSFHISNYLSADYLSAKHSAEVLNLPFIEITVPIDNIENDFITLIKRYKCIKKTQAECTFPWLYIFPKVKEKHIISGVCADGHYGLSKKAMIHYRDTKNDFDNFRKNYFQNNNPAGIRQMEQLAEEHDKKLISPYVHSEIINYFMLFDWEQLNKPKQKYHVLYNYFKYFKLTGTRPHSNLQLNANIPAVFERLLDNKELNYNNRKRVMDLVHDYAKKYGWK